MENPSQQHDPQLARFDQWLKRSEVEAPIDMVARVRARLQDSSSELDSALDDLLQPDYRMRDPSMLQKVRRRISADDSVEAGHFAWFKWLPPLAAAAILTLAFMSFQVRGPHPAASELGTAPMTLAAVESTQGDLELTRIIALASQLQGDSNMTVLDSVEDLAFLFD